MNWVLAWVPLLVLMVGNGALREGTYGRRLSELRAHQLSTVSGAAIVFGYTWFVLDSLSVTAEGEAVRLGALWLLLTILFEFGFGRLVAQRSWRELLSEYDLRSGRVWALLLVWVLLVPWLVYRLQ